MKQRRPFALQLALKKRFKNMTFCYKCKHLDGFQSCKKVGHNCEDVKSCCAACGSFDIVRRPTIVLARIFWSLNWSETKSPGVLWPEGMRRVLLREELDRIWESGESSETEDSPTMGVET